MGCWCALIITLLLVLLSVLNTEEEEEADWSQDGYEDNLSVTYGAVAEAPNVMSMEKSVLDISPPVPVEVVSPEQSGPPVPEADFRKAGPWSNGITMVNNGLTIKAEFTLRWVEEILLMRRTAEE